MRNSVKILSMLMAAAAITSCVNLDWDQKKQEAANNSTFAQMVGQIDRFHTWNLAKKGSVTVNTQSPTDVKVYSFDGKKYSLLAHKTIDGSEKLDFNVFTGINEVIVENQNNGAFKTVSLGGTVSFGGTRTITEYTDADSPIKIKTGDYAEFKYEVVKADVASTEFTDLKNAKGLFIAAPEKEGDVTATFSLNTVWYTSQAGDGVTVGIYYYNTDGTKIYQMDFFQRDGKNDEMIYETPWTADYWQAYTDAHMPSLANYGAVKNCKSKSMTITVPANRPFGFYIHGGNDQKAAFYSENKYNVAPNNNEYNGPFIDNNERGNYGHIAVINIDGRQYLAFDDFYERKPHSYTNPEYDHLVMSFSGFNVIDIDVNNKVNPVEYLAEQEEEEEEEEEKEEKKDDPVVPVVTNGDWIIACEDVYPGSNGSTCDYDFNDIVFSVSHVTGDDFLTVKFLAAGCTLANNVFFGDTDLGEIHEILGVTEKVKAGDKEVFQMINTTIYGPNVPAVTRTIPLNGAAFDITENMGGFKIVRQGKYQSVISAPTAGSAPYMICVPGDWKYLAENKKITDAYPTFAGWSADHTTNLDWYKNCTATGLLYKKPEAK